MNSHQTFTTPPLSSSELTLSNALQELARIKQESFQVPQGARTAQEWADAWGVGVGKARRILRGLLTGGRMESLRQPIKDMAGRTNHTFVYKLVNHEEQS